MGLKNFFGLERRQEPRHEVAVDVEFQVWDESTLKPLTRKCSGGLTNISLEGACLQTNHILIAGHHLMIHNDVEGKTPLILEVPFSAAGEAAPRRIKAQVVWYKKAGEERRFQFDVGLKFVGLSDEDQKNLQRFLHPAGV
jgi:c-di-GMP-binding flagellar brake protein YcgR